jgi:glyoxylase-like metal-dependent hydrolase (beta-lactamase superfamily II)
VSAYLVDGLLIDTGCALTASEFIGCIGSSRIDLAVNTHYHEDHVGANNRVRKKFGVDFFAHPDSVPLIKEPPELAWYRIECWGRPESCDTMPIPAKVETSRYVFDVIETPGHCRGHVALVERTQGWCFSGDLYVAGNMFIAGPETDISAVMSSMKRLLDLDVPRLILFTSVGAIEMEGKKALQASIENLRDAAAKAKALQRKGLTLTTIRDKVLGGPSSVDRITEGLYSTENFVRQLLDRMPD